MIKILLGLGILFILLIFPKLRCYLLNLPVSFPYTLRDLFLYVLRKKWRIATSGELNVYCGLFGQGKTLSAVHATTQYYNRYHNKKVYDENRHKYVMQQVIVLSNIHLNNIPYIEFKSLHQMCELMHQNIEYDSQHDTLTYLWVLGDEFSVQMNSRNFKSNLDPLTLNSILTCRHYRTSMVLTSQRFNHMDALLRQVTQYVYQCSKTWRLQGITKYDAFSIENASNPDIIKPIIKNAWFVRNRDYKAYDTLACVDNLEHSALIGDTLSSAEILQNLNLNQNPEAVTHYRKSYKKNKTKIS